MNSGIRELYLADNGLDLYDAIQLGSLLRINNHLQLLDIRYALFHNCNRVKMKQNVFLVFLHFRFIAIIDLYIKFRVFYEN